MTDQSLAGIWASDNAGRSPGGSAVIRAVLDEDRAARQRELVARVAATIALAILCPVLVWCAAYGKTPLVRGGYALMAMGAAIVVFAEWIYLTWSQQAQPGAADARSQLHTSAVMLLRLAALMRTAGVWCAPVFVGTAFIGTWLYQERSHAGGYLLWSIVLIGWSVVVATSIAKAARLERRRTRLQELIADLNSRE